MTGSCKGPIGSLKGPRVLDNTFNCCNYLSPEADLEIAKTLEEVELPKVTYHRQCCSIFTLKRNLGKLSPPTVANLPSDNPRPILVEFFSGFVPFAKRINTPGTLAQGRN